MQRKVLVFPKVISLLEDKLLCCFSLVFFFAFTMNIPKIVRSCGSTINTNFLLQFVKFTRECGRLPFLLILASFVSENCKPPLNTTPIYTLLQGLKHNKAVFLFSHTPLLLPFSTSSTFPDLHYSLFWTSSALYKTCF